MEHKTWFCYYQEKDGITKYKIFTSLKELATFTKKLDKRIKEGTCKGYGYRIMENGG